MKRERCEEVIEMKVIPFVAPSKLCKRPVGITMSKLQFPESRMFKC